MLNIFSLYLVTDTASIGQKGLIHTVMSAVQGGVTAVQLREKNTSTKEFIETAKNLKKALSSSSVPLIINDRVDVALAANADGVHLGQTDMSYFDAKRIMGDRAILGLTVENIEQVKMATDWGVTYFGLSSLFKTGTKSEANAYWNKTNIGSIKKLSNKPLIGIGGINSSNIKKVISWGLDGVALASAICSCSNLSKVKKETEKLRREIDKYNEGN